MQHPKSHLTSGVFVIYNTILKLVIHACAVGLVAGEQTGCGYVGRMIGIDRYICHGGEYGREDYIPGFGGIFVDTYFYRLQWLYDLGKCHERFFEFCCYLKAFLRGACKLECDYVLYHFNCT